MSDNKDKNFSVKETCSYAYVDGKYAKIAVAANGNAVLADPLRWSYAETHSYVKVDPSSIGVSAPSGVDDVYAKVIYLAGGGSGGSSSQGGSQIDTSNLVTKSELSAAINSISVSAPASYLDISDGYKLATTGYVDEKLGSIYIPSLLSEFTNDTDFASKSYVTEKVLEASSGGDITIGDLAEFATTGYVDSKISAITIPAYISELENDIGFATSSYVDERLSTVGAEYATTGYIEDRLTAIEVPTAVSELENDAGFITSAYVDAAIVAIEIPQAPSAVSQLSNDSEFVTSSEVATAIATAISEIPQVNVPSSLSELTDDIGLATVQELNDAISAISIPTNISQLNNDIEFVTSTYVDAAIANAAPPEINVPSALSELHNDTEFIPSSAISSMISAQIEAIEIPTKLSELENDTDYATTGDIVEAIANAAGPDVVLPSAVSAFDNDANYVTRSEVQEMLSSLSIQFSNRLIEVQSQNTNSVVSLGERDSDNAMSNVQLDGREEDQTIIDFGSRV